MRQNLKTFVIVYWILNVLMFNGISFYYLSFDPGIWSKDARAVFVVGIFFWLIISAFLTDVVFKKKGGNE